MLLAPLTPCRWFSETPPEPLKHPPGREIALAALAPAWGGGEGGSGGHAIVGVGALRRQKSWQDRFVSMETLGVSFFIVAIHSFPPTAGRGTQSPSAPATLGIPPPPLLRREQAGRCSSLQLRFSRAFQPPLQQQLASIEISIEAAQQSGVLLSGKPPTHPAWPASRIALPTRPTPRRPHVDSNLLLTRK
jgi:hypothetical protein